MKTPQQIIGVLFRSIAVVVFAWSVFWLGYIFIALPEMKAGDTINLHLSLSDYVLPFLLWFLGSELTRSSENARQVTRAGLIYLCIVLVVVLIFMLVSGMTATWPPAMKQEVYGVGAIGLWACIVCIYVLRKRNVD